MGLLDDAIREHLELKRRHGADPDEVARQENEALGETRRAEFARPEGAEASVEPAAEQAPADEAAEPVAEVAPEPEAEEPQEAPVEAEVPVAVEEPEEEQSSPA